MRIRYSTVSALVVATGIGLAASTTVLADDEASDIFGDEIADPEAALETEEVTDEDLRGFLEAAEAIEGIRADYVEQIVDAEPGDRAGLRDEANEAMLEAIDDAGIDAEIYRSIGYRFGTDDDMIERLNAAAAERAADE